MGLLDSLLLKLRDVSFELGSGLWYYGFAMKLYKIVEMRGKHASTLMPLIPVQTVYVEASTMAGYGEIYAALSALGFTHQQIWHMIQSNYTYNLAIMRLPPTRAWEVTWSALSEFSYRPPPALPPKIYYCLSALAIAALVIALVEPIAVYPHRITPPTSCYMMGYEERMWFAELHYVSPGGVGYYDICGELGGPVLSHQRHVPFPPGEVDRFGFLGTLNWEGRPLLLYHNYWWDYFDAKFIGVVSHVAQRLYKLREGQYDPFLPPGPYRRSGGLCGDPDYDGIYKGNILEWPWI